MSRTRNIVLVSLTIALTTAGAYLRIPLPISPVPVSLQTLFVLLSGALLGPWLGTAAMTSYILLGLIGLPVFTGGGGPQYVLSPTFGFLLSFPVSAMVVGLVLRFHGDDQERSIGRKLLAMILGTGVVYLVGVPWLWLNLFLVQGKKIALPALLMMGMVPFLPGDLLKILLATWLIGPIRRNLKQVRG